MVKINWCWRYPKNEVTNDMLFVPKIISAKKRFTYLFDAFVDFFFWPFFFMSDVTSYKKEAVSLSFQLGFSDLETGLLGYVYVIEDRKSGEEVNAPS